MMSSRPSRPSVAPRRQAAALRNGDVVGGHYVIEELLDEGGMAVVYEARNSATGKTCAIKILHAQLGEQPEFMRLFAKEARVGSVIGDSEHIVSVFDAGLDAERGLPFIVMELLEGETLEHALHRGPLPPGEVSCYLGQLSEALGQAHDAGVVHRDLKPSNLFIAREDDEPPMLKVMDFGIAKVLEGEAIRTATQIGTPAYTAPEQMGSTTRRLAAKQGITIARGISPATDVWAIGLIAYEMLTGLRPGHYWDIETMTELPMKIAFEALDNASTRAADKSALLPAGFDPWFSRCMRKDAAERWSDAREAITALLELMERAQEDADVIDVAPVKLPPPFPTTSDLLPTMVRGAARPATIAAKPAGLEDALPPSATPPPPEPEPAARRSTGDPVVAPVSNEPRGRMSRWAYAGAVAAAALGFVGWLGLQEPSSSAAQLCLSEAQVDGRAEQCESACGPDGLQSCARLGELYEQGDGVAADAKRAASLYAQACGVTEAFPSPGSKALSGEARRAWLKRVEKSACTVGNCVGAACAELASFYQDGNGGLAKSERAATALFKRSCQLEDPAGAQQRGVAGCVGLGQQRQRAGQSDAAQAYFKAACDGGVAVGCVALADSLQSSDAQGAEKTARGLYQRACDDGELNGCTQLGQMVERGRGGWVKDEPAAVALYKRACDGSELSGCVALANAYLRGKGGLSRDAVRAVELYGRSCDGGELTGCARLASMTAKGKGGIAKNEKRAFALNKKACDGGALYGCANLGQMYLAGDAGLTKDEREGRALLERSCKGGSAMGCLKLARFGLSSGKLPPKRVATLMNNACEQGEPDGCAGLGALQEENSEGAEQDLERAAALYQRACSEGSMRGCTNLANLTYRGAGGLTKDAKKSFALNEQACKGGDSVGCTRLGLLHALGQGTAKNQKRATELFRGACLAEPGKKLDSRCSLLQELIAPGSGNSG